MDFHRRRKIDATIDMTPMIDTLLQLFVVFLLCMTFAASAVRLDLPQASVRQQAPDTPVVVSLDENNNLYVNQEAVAREQLPGRLHALFAEGERREVTLRAHRTLAYATILDTLVEIQQAGVANIALAYDHEPRR
jgi:biopolymer transport protein ExbD